MNGKKSFLLYTDIIHTVRKMPKEKAGELFLTILSYVNDENPVVEDIVVDLVFEPIKQGLKRDLEKWKIFIEKQSLNGKRGGRPKEPKKPKPFIEKPKKPTNVSVSVNDNVNVLSEMEIVFRKWEEFRLSIKKPIHPASREAAMKKLITLSNNNPSIALLIVEESVANGYQGLFPLKNNKSQETTERPKIEPFKNNLGIKK